MNQYIENGNIKYVRRHMYIKKKEHSNLTGINSYDESESWIIKERKGGIIYGTEQSKSKRTGAGK